MARKRLVSLSALHRGFVGLPLLLLIECSNGSGGGKTSTGADGDLGGKSTSGDSSGGGGRPSASAGGEATSGSGGRLSGGGAGNGGASSGRGGNSGAASSGNSGIGGASSGRGGNSGAASSGSSGSPSGGGGIGTSGSGSGTTAVTFSTNFDLTESSLKEGGAWSTGLDPLQTRVSTANGIAFGTQTGAEFALQNYNDSEAWLAGTFPPNQRASAVIHKAPGLAGGYQEVEIVLRWSVGALRTGLTYGDTHSYGYEINLAWDGQYALIARFKEPAIFDSLVSGSPITSLGVKDGDIFSAEIVGNTITAKLTRGGVTTVLGSATDNSATPFPSGAPGIGYYRGTNVGSTTNSTSFAFTSFTATSL